MFINSRRHAGCKFSGLPDGVFEELAALMRTCRGLRATSLITRRPIETLTILLPCFFGGGLLAPDCARRHIPNPATLERIKYTWVSNVQKLPPADFNNLHQGSDIPDLTTDANEFTLAIDDIYGAKMLLAPAALSARC
jgi:hypothetical protein